MSTIFVSSPGKLILHGEHAVVYEKKALAVSLDLRTYLQITNVEGSLMVHVSFPDIAIEKEWNVEDIINKLPEIAVTDYKDDLDERLLNLLKQMTGLPYHSDTRHLALVAFLYLYIKICKDGQNLPALQIKIQSRLPTGAGLGSSAAFATCMATGFLLQRNRLEIQDTSNNFSNWTKKDLDLINHWAFQAERIIHGKPSGIDNSVSTFGGALSFCSGTITPLSRLPRIRIILFNTRQSRSTKQLVSNVRQKFEKYPEIIEPILCSMEAIAEKSIQTLQHSQSSLTNENFATLEELIEMNQHLLNIIGVGHPKLSAVCQIAHRHKLAAKLTGAGGGGCAFAFIPEDWTEAQVKSCIQEALSTGFNAWETTIGGQGIQLHSANEPSLPFK